MAYQGAHTAVLAVPCPCAALKKEQAPWPAYRSVAASPLRSRDTCRSAAPAARSALVSADKQLGLNHGALSSPLCKHQRGQSSNGRLLSVHSPTLPLPFPQQKQLDAKVKQLWCGATSTLRLWHHCEDPYRPRAHDLHVIGCPYGCCSGRTVAPNHMNSNCFLQTAIKYAFGVGFT